MPDDRGDPPPKAPAEPIYLVSFRPGITLRETEPHALALTLPLGTMTLREVSPALRSALGDLTAGRHSVEAVHAKLMVSSGPADAARFLVHIEHFDAQGILQYTVDDGAGPIASLVPTGRGFRLRQRPFKQAEPHTLSRFVVIRRLGRDLCIESPLGRARVLVHGPTGAAVLSQFAAALPPAQLLRGAPGLSPAAAAGFLQLLLNAEALTPCDTAGRSAEDIDATLAQWSFADLYFHSRSRFGRCHTEPFGALFRHIGEIAPLPAIKPLPVGKQTSLPRPDLVAITQRDPPFTQVLETRQSSYRFGEVPITRRELGEFLFRSARVRSIDRTEVARRDGIGKSDMMEITSRPYPSGGRGYDLEIYLAVDRCADVERGLHHYDPLHHFLTCVRPADAKVEALLSYAAIAAPGCRPQVLVILASRFQRLSWKYEAIAYATTLKHVGVVQQTMYLVATAMGLACSALGSGDADAFAQASGENYLVEGSVGEFILGSRALDPSESSSREEDMR